MTCFEATASAFELESSRDFTKRVLSGKCQYCGAPAIGGSGGLPVPGEMEERLELWCEQCRRDLVEFHSRPENAIPDFPFDDDAAQEQVSQQLAEQERRLREYMQQKIRERSQR